MDHQCNCVEVNFVHIEGNIHKVCGGIINEKRLEESKKKVNSKRKKEI